MAANESSHLPERKKNHPDTDLKKLKSQYGPKLSTLRELFADWSDEDLVFALQEADGDLELTIDRISEGMHYQSMWYIMSLDLAINSLLCYSLRLGQSVGRSQNKEGEEGISTKSKNRSRCCCKSTAASAITNSLLQSTAFR